MSAQSDFGDDLSTPAEASPLLHELEGEVETELALVESSVPADDVVPPVSEWLFDPTEIQQEEASLRSLLGAVEALEGDQHHQE